MFNQTNQDASFQMVPYFFCSSLNWARHKHRTDWYSLVDEYNTRFLKIARPDQVEIRDSTMKASIILVYSVTSG